MVKNGKGGPKPRYPWPKLQNGRWHHYHWSASPAEGEKAFSCNPKSFVSLLHRRADADDLDVETESPTIDSVKFRFFVETPGDLVKQEAGK